MKKILLLSLLMIVGCSDGDPKKDEPSTNPGETQEPSDGECTSLTKDSSALWKSGSHVIGYSTYNDKSILVVDNDIAQIMSDGTLFWIYSSEHEGYRQKYKVVCDCEHCRFSFSDYAEEPNDDYITEFVAVPSDDAVIVPEPRVSTINPDASIQGKYYWVGSSDYKDAAVEISSVSATIHYEDGSYIVMSFIEKLSETEYLVNHVGSEGTTLPFATETGNWFSVLKIEKTGEAEACSVCGAKHDQHYKLALSSYWSHYRSITKDKVSYDKTYDIHSINFDECVVTPLAAMEAFKGSWTSEKGDWLVDYDQRTKTPYDAERTLQYLETTKIDGDMYRMLFTYGTVSNINHADPNRFSNVYVYTMEVQPDGDCMNVKSNLSSDAIWANESDAELTDLDRVCKSATGTTSVYENIANAKRDNGDTITVTDDHFLLTIADDSKKLSADIVRYARNVVTEDAVYFDNLVIKVNENSDFFNYSECVGKYTTIRLYYYANGSMQSAKPYLNFQYPKALSCFESADDEGIGNLTLNNILKEFYY